MPSVPVNTRMGTEFYEHWYSPHTEWERLNRHVYRLPEHYSFDLDRARAQLTETRKQFELKPFPIRRDSPKKRMTYRGLGLSTRPGNDEYDALHLYGSDGELDITEVFSNQADNLPSGSKKPGALYEKCFTEKTPAWSGYFAEILGRFRSPTTKVRLLELLPRGVITSHVDFPYYEQIRVHAMLETNDDVWWEVEGEKFQIPSDGNFYWFDTGKYHAVYNDGSTSRVGLSVNLDVYRDRDSSQRLFDLIDSASI